MSDRRECGKETVFSKEPELHSGIPRHVLESLARCLLPDIRAFFESEEGQREFEAWKEKQRQGTPDKAP